MPNHKITRTIITGAMILFVSLPLLGLDTTESFSRGAITEFEGYYRMDAAAEGRSHVFDLLAGGGFTDTFSYLFTTAIAMTGSSTEIAGLCLGFIWTVVDYDSFAFDVLPYGSMNACCRRGHIAYPGMKSWSFGTDFEINLKFISSPRPYFRGGYRGTWHSELNHLTWEIPLTTGIMVPVSRKDEFFLQAGWVPGEESVWYNSERSLAAGLNIVTGRNLELITELSWEFNARNLSLGIGLIYAL